jgi:hypothetical protein
MSTAERICHHGWGTSSAGKQQSQKVTRSPLRHRNVFTPNFAKLVFTPASKFYGHSILEHETRYPYGFRGFPNFLLADGGMASRPRPLPSLNSQFFTHSRPSIQLWKSYSLGKTLLKKSVIERPSLYTQIEFRVTVGELSRRLSV